jgi:hypothetical protein
MTDSVGNNMLIKKNIHKLLRQKHPAWLDGKSSIHPLKSYYFYKLLKILIYLRFAHILNYQIKLLRIWLCFKGIVKHQTSKHLISKLKKMSCRSGLTSKLYDKIIKMPSKSHKIFPLKLYSWKFNNATDDHRSEYATFFTINTCFNYLNKARIEANTCARTYPNVITSIPIVQDLNFKNRCRWVYDALKRQCHEIFDPLFFR